MVITHTTCKEKTTNVFIDRKSTLNLIKKLASKIEQYIHDIFEDILKIFKIFGYFGGISKFSKKNWKTLKILENFVICWEISNYNFQIMTERRVYS